MKVGVVGLGRMGAPMTRRLVSAGYTVSAFDVNASLRSFAIAAGAAWHDSPADVAGCSDAVVVSVPGPAELDTVMRGARGMLGAAGSGLIVIQTSTVGPEQSRAIASECEARQVHFLDAPVSGGVEAAEAGTLAVMVGGEADVVQRARAVLEVLGSHVFHMGPAGAGSAMKLVVQSIFLSQVASFLEAVSLGERVGLPVEVMVKVVAESSAHQPAIGKRYGKIVENDLSPRLAVTAALKDLRLAMELWGRSGTEAPITGAATQAYEKTARLGFDDKDVIALRELYRRRA